MADGDIDYARFPVTLELNVLADLTPQVSFGPGVLFTTSQFPVLDAKVLPMTGSGGISKAVVLVVGRAIS